MNTPLTVINELFEKKVVQNQVTEETKDNWYNCWGFVAYSLNWIDELDWVNRSDMLEYLEEHTEVINEDEVEVGDICCFYGELEEEDDDLYDGILELGEECLQHATLVAEVGDDHVLVGKDGGWPLSVRSVTNVLVNLPEYGSVVEYRRIVK